MVVVVYYPEWCPRLGGAVPPLVIPLSKGGFTDSHKASSNMLTAGAVAPAVKPPAPAVESKLWHCGGQAVST